MATLNKINITGVVGLDTKYEDIVKQLDNCKGDIEIKINSPGGYVYDGIAIYNSIKNYNEGSKTIRVCGLSASIATYIMLAGDKLELEENSVLMIHNPSVCVMGDYRKLKTAYTSIEKLRFLMSSAYSNYLKIDRKEVETMMDNETFFIGKEELKTWGNVLKDTDNAIRITKAEAEFQIQAMSSLLKTSNEKTDSSAKKLVAFLEDYQGPQQKENTNTELLITKLSTNQKETKMEKLENLNDLKLHYPKLYDEAINIGIQQEKSRVKAHLEFIDVAPDIALNAIKEDIEFLNNSEIQAKYIKAKVNKNELATMEKDNNPEVLPKKINEYEELKSELEESNEEAEKKIRAYMPHLMNGKL